MKIDLTAKQNFVSESSTKKQQANAKILFGSKGISILSKLEPLAKEKLLSTQGIDQLLAVLKTKDTAGLEKFAGSKTGKNLIAACKKLASAKTFSAIMSNIKSIRPSSALTKLSDGGYSKSVQRSIAPKSSDREVKLKSSIVNMSKLLKGKYLQLFNSTVKKGFLFNGEDLEISTLALLVANMTKSKVSDYFEFMDGDDSVEIYTASGDKVDKQSAFKKFNKELENGSRENINKGLIKLIVKGGYSTNEAEVMLEEFLDDSYPHSAVLAALIANGVNVSSLGFPYSDVRYVKKAMVQF